MLVQPGNFRRCDALSRNLPKLPGELEIIVGHWLAHSRRRFVEVTPNFPEECRFVLERFHEVYVNDALAREQNMTAEQRLAFHQAHTGQVMEQLKVWLKAQFEERRVEPNSGLGIAITYPLKHWEDPLRGFRVPFDGPVVTFSTLCTFASQRADLQR